VNQTVTVENLQPVDALGWKLKRLPPRQRIEVVRQAVLDGVKAGLADRGVSGLGGMSNLSADVVGAAVERVLRPMMPALGAELVKVVEPAAQKAADVVGPAIEQNIKKYGPTLAIITGLVAATLSVIGMLVVGGYVVKKVGKRAA
jgi:hypothetical protein